jgi:hypothetical protein
MTEIDPETVAEMLDGVTIPDDEPRQIVCTGEAGSNEWHPAFGSWEADDFGIGSDEAVGSGERLFVNRRLLEALAARVAELEASLERDRTNVMETVNAVHSEIAGRQWLLDGRGPYGWDDDRYKDEFAAALDAIRKPLEVLRKIGADWTNCPTDPAAIRDARINWKHRAEVAEAKLAAKEAEVERRDQAAYLKGLENTLSMVREMRATGDLLRGQGLICAGLEANLTKARAALQEAEK